MLTRAVFRSCGYLLTRGYDMRVIEVESYTSPYALDSLRFPVLNN